MLYKKIRQEQKACECLWAKEKYAVLARSHKTYLEIRERLKDKEHPNYDIIRRLIESAKDLPPCVTDAVNAAEHVWGYFKEDASSIEKHAFFKMLNEFKHGQTTETILRKNLFELLCRYPNPYLAQSTYFDDVRIAQVPKD